MGPRSRYFAAGLLAVAPLVGPVAAGPFVSEGDPAVHAEVAVTFQDERIDESSGLVVRDGRLFTVNDSGDGPYVYEVDLRTGETVAVTAFSDEDPDDVEALAAGPGGALWVGDIGDNRRWRDSLRVHRLVPDGATGRAPAATFELAYPDGPHDAEAMLVHPRTGRLLVVTKQFVGGGRVYQGPRRLREGETHVLEPVAEVAGVITDGTFLDGGERLVLRSYGVAVFYSYPDFRRLGEAPLPWQDQGEGIAVNDGAVYLSTEGERSEVLTLGLDRLERAAARAAREPGPPEPRPREDVSQREYDPEPWMGLGPTLLGLTVVGAGAVLLLLRAALRRS
jgi:hypothetical protein